MELTPLENGNYRITMPEGTILDLGAIAKGYIADKIKDYLLAHDVTSAMINLGGNVLCVGGKSDSKDFTVGVKKPFTQSNELLLTLNLRDCSVVSSGTYERYFYENDTFYHHILNPGNRLSLRQPADRCHHTLCRFAGRRLFKHHVFCTGVRRRSGTH